MKSGYKTIPEEEESKPLTKAGIAETGGSPITKKYLVLVSLGLVIMGFLMGHRTNTHHSDLRTSQESMTAQLVDSKELVDSEVGRTFVPNRNNVQQLLDLPHGPAPGKRIGKQIGKTKKFEIESWIGVKPEEEYPPPLNEIYERCSVSK